MFERKYNEYKIENKIVYGTTLNGKYQFWFDIEYFNLVSQYCWHRHADGYFRTRIGVNKEGKVEYKLLHVLIMEKAQNYVYDKTHEIDHKDGNPSNNCLSNLEIKSHSDNMKNIKKYANNSTGAKGVHFSKLEKKYKAYINYNGKRIHLGTFSNIEEAVKARESAEVVLFGDKRRKN